MVINCAGYYPALSDTKGQAIKKRFLTLREDVLKIYFQCFFAN